MDCQYCQRSFSNIYLLTQHQTKAKYCLTLQGMSLSQKDKYECKYCSKLLCSNERLYTHFETCKEKIKKECDEKNENEITRLQQIIAEQQSTIAKLEAKLEKFENAVIAAASEPKTKTTTTNVVVNNNTLNLSQEHVTKVLDEHFTKEVAAGGQKGLAKMVHEKMLTGPDGKPTYVCVDSSRQTFEFTNNDGDVERDVKAKKLTKALINSKIQQKAAEVGNQIWTKADGNVDSTLYEYCSPKVMELACFEKDDSKFRSELSALTS